MALKGREETFELPPDISLPVTLVTTKHVGVLPVPPVSEVISRTAAMEWCERMLPSAHAIEGRLMEASGMGQRANLPAPATAGLARPVP